MRMLAFLVLVLAGALAGWAIGQDEALATRLVLAAVGAIFATGGWLLTRMARVDLPERFTARAGGPTAIGAEP